MWLSKRIGPGDRESDAAAAGTVSIGGDDAAVVTDAERRSAKIISPGGYIWQPSAGQEVLVLKTTDTYIPGAVQSRGALAPGEVMIYSDGAQILLRSSGEIAVSGNVRITGQLFVNGKEIGADDGESSD